MTKLIALYFATVLAAIAATHTVPTTGIAATLTFSVVNNEVIIDSCNWDVSGELEIPVSIDDKNVTSIGAGAFAERNGLTSVKIGNSVALIGEYSFWGCINLTNITLGNSVTSIGQGAFQHTLIDYDLELDHLKYVLSENELSAFLVDSSGASGDILIPRIVNGATVRSVNAFESNLNITSVRIPDSVTSIGNRAFIYCSLLTSMTIPDSVTLIGESAFEDCINLTSVKLPDKVTSIGISAFDSCTSLTDVIVPDSVTSIGEAAFVRCIGLTNMTIPDNVTSIGEYAFSECTTLATVFIGNGVNSIEPATFLGCTSLSNVTIGNGVRSIGTGAFQHCTSLSTVVFDGVAPTVELAAFPKMAEGARAIVQPIYAYSFGGAGISRYGLTVELAQLQITRSGLLTAETFFIEFKPPGLGYRVMSSTTLDFGDSIEITSTLEPIVPTDNRFVFPINGPTNFYRLEAVIE